MLSIPSALQPGDTIGLIAPARKTSAEELTDTILFIQSHGYKVKFADRLFAIQDQFAGSDEERAANLMQMFADKEVKAILCARGGYGSVRMLPYLNVNIIKANPKWLIGYSDVTVLHSYLHTVCKMQTLHATMPVNFSPDKAQSPTWVSLIKNLSGERFNISCEAHPLNRPGEASGILVGGNLSVLYSLRGTPADIDTDGKILFIEDLDEYLYHIDRMMMNLKLGNKLSKLKGLIVGGMSDMKDNAVPFGKTAEEIVADAVKEYDYPVLFGFPAGHQEENLPLVLGAQVQMKGNELIYLIS